MMAHIGWLVPVLSPGAGAAEPAREVRFTVERFRAAEMGVVTSAPAR